MSEAAPTGVPDLRAEATEAAKAAAFTTEDGRQIIHCLLGGFGADWDLAKVLALIEQAEAIYWQDSLLGHELAVVANRDSRGASRYDFDVRRPAAAPRAPTGLAAGGIYDEIAAERVRAHAKHGDKSMESAAWDAPKRLRILMEEVGEIARAFNDWDLGLLTEDECRAQVRKEALQTAAMATAWVQEAGRV